MVPWLLPSGTEGPGKIKTSCPGQLVLSPSGQHVATIDKHSCFVWAAGASATGRRAKPLNLTHTKPYTVSPGQGRVWVAVCMWRRRQC